MDVWVVVDASTQGFTKRKRYLSPWPRYWRLIEGLREKYEAHVLYEMNKHAEESEEWAAETLGFPIDALAASCNQTPKGSLHFDTCSGSPAYIQQEWMWVYIYIYTYLHFCMRINGFMHAWSMDPMPCLFQPLKDFTLLALQEKPSQLTSLTHCQYKSLDTFGNYHTS